MNLARIAVHRAWRGLPLWALAAGFNTSALLGLAFWYAATQRTSVSTWMTTLVAWIGLAAYLAFGGLRTRATQFEISLPASTRRLWLLNLATHLAGGIFLVVLTIGAVAARAALAPRVELAIRGRFLAALLVAGLLLATLLLQVPRPSLARIPLGAGQIVWTVAVLAGTPFLLGAAAAAGWPGVASLLVAAVVVALWSYRSVPAAYALAPFEADATRSVVRREGFAGASARRWVVPLTIVRGVSAGAKELLAFPFILLFAIALGNGLLAINDGDLRELRFLYLPMTTYMLYALIGPRLASLHRIDFLPVSRRILAMTLVLPYFLVVCVGYGVGTLIASGARSRLQYVDFRQSDEGCRVCVPLRVYRLARDGRPPDLESPWGEVHAAEALRPFGWSRMAVYSPYDAPPGSSARFVALQISRAVAATYGASISPEVIEERYLATGPDGGVVPRGEGLTLREDYPALEPRSGPMLPALLALTVVPWLLLVAMLLRGYRGSVGEWVRQTTVWGALGLLLVFAIGTSIAAVFRVIEFWSIRALIEIPVMRLGSTMTGTMAVWTAATALIGGAYLVVQRQFERMEIPTTPSRYTLIDWPRT